METSKTTRRAGGGTVQPLVGGAPSTAGAAGPFGIPASETILALQTDSYQELVNKLAWCLGSVYRAPYSNRRSPIRIYAQRLATAVVKAHGYPGKISLP